jgi:hypothetical protein
MDYKKTRTLATGFSMADGPPASYNINYVRSRLQDSVAAQDKSLDKSVHFYALDFGGAHSAFRLMITCAVRRYGLMLRTLHVVCRPYLATADSVVRLDVFRIFGVSPEVRQTHDQINSATRMLSPRGVWGA